MKVGNYEIKDELLMKTLSKIFFVLFYIALSCCTAYAATESYQPEYNGAYSMKADGTPMTLINHDDATQPTYQEVIDFLKTDQTDAADKENYDCVDRAEQVHNNAEACGIECGVVDVFFKRCKVGNTVYRSGHECNVFNTVDRGLVYTDCTQGDWIACVEEGEKYTLMSIYDDKTASLTGYRNTKVKETMRFW